MKKIIIASVVLFITISCSFGANPSRELGEEDSQPTQPETQEQPTDEPTIVPTVEKAKVVEATKIPTLTPRPTASPTPAQFPLIQEAVKQYGNPKLDELVASFSGNDVIYLDDFSETANQLKYIYNFPLYDYNPTNFVALTHMTWSHATSNITKSAAGCGFIFNNNFDNQRYYAVLTNDSNVRIIHLNQGYWDGIAHKKYTGALMSPNGEADFLVVVKGSQLVVAVNGEIVINQSFDWRSSGSFGYSILAGTNNPEGTRCDFSETTLIMEE